jgi:Polyketide cyclase / dehydrase and lipid transport
MAAIHESIEIARRPEDVFAYATDSSRFPEWQASVVSVRQEGPGPLAVGSRAVVTRRLGRRTVPGTEEITQLKPPRTWAWRAVGGPVTGTVNGMLSRWMAADGDLGEGWWACQDLNLGPHRYQQLRAQRCADRRFPRSPVTVSGEVMRS